AQQYIFQSEIGEFSNASSFYISPAGYIYVTDFDSDEIYKLDTLGVLLKEAGGYGWNSGSFDDPTGVYATTLNIYVCDKNNNRLQSFDKDLNFVSQLFTRESDNDDEIFGYPLSCAVSRQGDLFILDSENNRVVEFDLFGNFIRNFGGYDAGRFQLSKPVTLSAAENSTMFVLDNKNIVIFDNFGNGIASFPHKGLIDDMNIVFGNFTASNDTTVFISTISTNDGIKLEKVELKGSEPLKNIVSALVFNHKFYVLLADRIVIFRKLN
ncbi:MAG: NHL repeat-containing protein, partial [Ignavibacteriaceae bacterium]|nr:NHL repeat-containing protein [Ignavibacteriaceae bacterium]